jgi:hypothetical protein
LLVFLKEICVEQVMDTWIEFASSSDVALERVEVCKLLADRDPENNDIYQSEIRDIMRRLTIRKRITEVEQSKIYVDTESVKDVAKRVLCEDYKRYLAFRRSGMSQEHRKAIIIANNSIKSGHFEEFLALKFPRNEMSALLEKMVVYLRDEFVASSQHGLDGYLSVRIRHGTLESQLRSAFESEFLLTHKCAEAKEYSPNQFWLERLAFVNSQDADEVNRCFKDFSSQFDSLVNTIKKEWIQIQKKPDDPGRINFVLLEPEIDYICTCMSEETTLDEFIGLVLDYFITDKLEPSLKNMRRDVQEEIKPRLNELLTQLQTSVEKIGPNVRVHELRSAIGRARPACQNTLDRVASWLRLAKTEKKEPFLLDEVISISESSVRASCSAFSVVRKIDEPILDLLLQASLPSFVDVMCLIFDNIVRHSGYTDQPEGTVTATFEEPFLCIRVDNRVSDCAATDSKRRQVDEIRKTLTNQLFSTSVSKEGGTGFIKAQKILNHDFRMHNGQFTPSLSFGFTNDNGFCVEVKIPIRIVTMEVDE